MLEFGKKVIDATEAGSWRAAYVKFTMNYSYTRTHKWTQFTYIYNLTLVEKSKLIYWSIKVWKFFGMWAKSMLTDALVPVWGGPKENFSMCSKVEN